MGFPKAFRNWTSILYPESCVQHWREILDDLHIMYAVSPLHEFDVDPDGELKKAHWHIVFIFDGKKSYQQMLEICHMIGAINPQNVLNLRTIMRYLVHLDNPEKHQYNITDIEYHNGLSADDCFKLSSTDKHKIVMDVLHYIDENDINEYWDLLWKVESDHPEWMDVLLEGYTMILTNAINSRRNCIRNRRKHVST